MIRLNQNNINTPAYFNSHFDGRLATADMERAEAMAKYFHGGSYIDIGCWDSPMPILLAERFPDSDIYALDFADKVIDYLEKRFKKVNWICSDIRESNIPVKDNFMDYVVAGEIIEHMEDPQWFAKELMRICKPGGWVAISTPEKEADRAERLGGPLHLWSFDEQDMRDLFGNDSEVGFVKEGQYNSMLVWKQKK